MSKRGAAARVCRVAELTAVSRPNAVAPSADRRGADTEDGGKRARRPSFIRQQHQSLVEIEQRRPSAARLLPQEAIDTELQEPRAPEAHCRATDRQAPCHVARHCAVGQQKNDSASNNNACSECARSRELLQPCPFGGRQNQQTILLTHGTNFCNTDHRCSQCLNVVHDDADNSHQTPYGFRTRCVGGASRNLGSRTAVTHWQARPAGMRLTTSLVEVSMTEIIWIPWAAFASVAAKVENIATAIVLATMAFWRKVVPTRRAHRQTLGTCDSWST
jgi:hypothetical protein